jgi:polysaccharide export outer membrane protein
VKITIEVGSKLYAPPAAPGKQAPGAELPGVEPPPELKIPADAIAKIKPLPLPPIPDDPPPHEGAMLDLPEIVEPPDLLTIELLEALPGRPISGERLVRPDGTISLGFYGDIHVRGLTVSQVKEKVILHMRKHLIDDVLGLVEMDENGKWTEIAPKDSMRVFVQISAYNSKIFFVKGDVGSPGTFPVKGNETVLDVLTRAGGLTSTADRKNIRLVRPGRGGKPARVYPIDYEAIVEGGDREKNYQVFADDRIIVDRSPAGRHERVLEAGRVPIREVASPSSRVRTARR